MTDKEKITQLLQSRQIENINNAILIGCVGQKLISLDEVIDILCRELKAELYSQGAIQRKGYYTFLQGEFYIYIIFELFSLDSKKHSLDVMNISVMIYKEEPLLCIYHSYYPEQPVRFDPKILWEAVYIWIMRTFKDYDFC